MSCKLIAMPRVRASMLLSQLSRSRAPGRPACVRLAPGVATSSSAGVSMLVLPRLLALIGVVVAGLGCSATNDSAEIRRANASSDPCGPGGTLRPPNPNIVATTRTRNGQVIDWIPASSQTPDGTLAKPPPSAPTPPPSSPVSSPAGNQPQSADVDGAGIEPEARGPAGTVPILRSHRQLCDCHPGFVEQANGACAPVSETCVQEGGMASAKSFSHCCPDLVQAEALEPRDGQCISTAPSAHLCTRCGNGSCGPGENTCNCASDCKP